MPDEDRFRILSVSLPQKVVKGSISPEIVEMFLGGLGFNARTLYNEVGPEVDSLSADNIVVISPGALTGSGAPTACRTEITTKSPLTGIIGTGNFGGAWGDALKHAGYDSIIITGKSRKPVYLVIEDDLVEIREASYLWGLDCWNATDILKADLGKEFSVMSIGQAGENLVRCASVIVDYEHAAGRSHAGAVLGAKKLKAVAVKGTRRRAAVWEAGFEKARREAVESINSYPGWKAREKVGSIAVTMPDYAKLAEPYLVKGKSPFCPCFMGSHYGCTLTTDIKEGEYAGTKVVAAGLSLYGYMSKTLGVSLPATWKLKELHNRYGMDYWWGPLTFAMVLYERGIITNADTDGLELVQGNEHEIMEMLGKIARREGLGTILAEGSVRASRIIGRGSHEFVFAIKGMEFGADPREMKLENQLSFLVNPRGGDDLKGTHALTDFPGLPEWARQLSWTENRYLDWLMDRLDMFDEVKKTIFGVPPRLNDLDAAMLTKWYNDLTCAYNSLGFCMFACTTAEALGPTLLADLYSAYTGRAVRPSELMLTGERIFNLMRAYNVREGMKREHDNWPRIFYEQPLMRDEKPQLSEERIDGLLTRYYKIRGWDLRTGVPTQTKLKELGLHEVANDMSKLGY